MLKCEKCGSAITGRGRRYCSKKCFQEARPLADRFWEKVEKRSPSDCWNWTGATTFGGYGVIGIGHAKLLRAHVLSLTMSGTVVPAGMVVRHTCDNPACVNPAHLLVGTQKDNVGDMFRRGRAKPRRKFSDAEIASIISHPGTVRETASAFGLSFGYVSMLRNGKARSG